MTSSSSVMKQGRLPKEGRERDGGSYDFFKPLPVWPKAKELNTVKNRKEVKVISQKRKDKRLPGTHLLMQLLHVAAPLLNVIYLSLLLISFATSAMLCAVRKVILEFLTCVDMY